MTGPPNQSTTPETTIAEPLTTPRYHRALRHHFESTEPELWTWFSETTSPDADSIAEAELDLLKTAYRLDGSIHDVLNGFATLMAGRLGLVGTITLYQELGVGERNARVLVLGEGVHVVFGGDLLDLLDLGEQQAVLAHELAHVALWQRENGVYRILDHLVHRLAADPAASEAVDETARRLRLHTEVFADAIACALVDDDDDVISSIVKVQSGLRTVDPDAYLQQARQILEADPSVSRGWTHPELHVRVACLAAQRAADPETLVAGLIDGPDELDRLDLLGQLRLDTLTGRVLAAGRAAALARADGGTASPGEIDPAEIDRYLTSFPVAVHLTALAAEEQTQTSVLDRTVLETADPSIRHLCAALLVDLALVHDGVGTDLTTLAPLAIEADRLGIAEAFDKLVCQATNHKRRDLRLLRGTNPPDQTEPTASSSGGTGESGEP